MSKIVQGGNTPRFRLIPLTALMTLKHLPIKKLQPTDIYDFSDDYESTVRILEDIQNLKFLELNHDDCMSTQDLKYFCGRPYHVIFHTLLLDDTPFVNYVRILRAGSFGLIINHISSRRWDIYQLIIINV